MKNHINIYKHSVLSIAYFFIACNQSNADSDIWKQNEIGSPSTYNACDCDIKNSPEISKNFNSITFTGKYANYGKADTWYPSWASDGNMYSPWTDGTVGILPFVWSGGGKDSKTGFATIKGDNPMDLKITNYSTLNASAYPFQGRYPCGSLMYNGIWYYGSYLINQPNKEIKKDFGWYVLGPFMGFHWSDDYGKTWHKSPKTMDNPLFDEPKIEQLDMQYGKTGKFVKMGAPHFVDFGKNMEYSPDKKAYLVGHGSESPDSEERVANNSWVTGDAIYLARVAPSVENMNDSSKYEFYAGKNSNGSDIWTKNFSKIQPIFKWNNNCGIVTITYNKPLNRYFMCVTNGHRNTTSRKEYTSYIMESKSLTGDWKLVAYMKDFGPQAYFLNIPSKFISNDGRTMWLSYSANYMSEKNRNTSEYVRKTTPCGSAYSFSLHEFVVQN